MTERTMTAKNQKPNLRPKILSASLLIWGISGFYLLAMIWSLLSATGTYGTHEIQPWLAPAVTGLVPLAETGLTRDTDPRKSFPIGKDIEVIILEIDAAARRIRLSIKGVDDAKEAAEVRDYSQRSDAAHPQSFGSLADKLRGALDRRKP